MIDEFGLGVIERVPGFSVACKSCEGFASTRDQRRNQCKGSGTVAPRFRSVRGARHDYGLIACDEDGLAFWGISRKLPFDEATETGKYALLSSSRCHDASVSGLPKYHVAGRQFPVRDEVWVTEGIIKAEILPATGDREL